MRAMHEAQSHEHSMFVTLTYNDENCPGELKPDHLSDYIREVRRQMRLNHPELLGNRLRYIACGEYGSRTHRPHYHAIFFGLGTKDEFRYKPGLFKSPTLEKLWGKGQVRHGTLTPGAAAYTAFYTRKQTGITYAHPLTGEIIHAPFFRASTHPGIGHDYARRYASDIVTGRVHGHRGVAPVPRYYRDVIAKDDPNAAEQAAQAIHQNLPTTDLRHFTAEALEAKRLSVHQAVQRSKRNL